MLLLESNNILCNLKHNEVKNKIEWNIFYSIVFVTSFRTCTCEPLERCLKG